MSVVKNTRLSKPCVNTTYQQYLIWRGPDISRKRYTTVHALHHFYKLVALKMIKRHALVLQRISLERHRPGIKNPDQVLKLWRFHEKKGFVCLTNSRTTASPKFSWEKAFTKLARMSCRLAWPGWISSMTYFAASSALPLRSLRRK